MYASFAHTSAAISLRQTFLFPISICASNECMFGSFIIIASCITNTYTLSASAPTKKCLRIWRVSFFFSFDNVFLSIEYGVSSTDVLMQIDTGYSYILSQFATCHLCVLCSCVKQDTWHLIYLSHKLNIYFILKWSLCLHNVCSFDEQQQQQRFFSSSLVCDSHFFFAARNIKSIYGWVIWQALTDATALTTQKNQKKKKISNKTTTAAQQLQCLSSAIDLFGNFAQKF